MKYLCIIFLAFISPNNIIAQTLIANDSCFNKIIVEDDMMYLCIPVIFKDTNRILIMTNILFRNFWHDNFDKSKSKQEQVYDILSSKKTLQVSDSLYSKFKTYIFNFKEDSKFKKRGGFPKELGDFETSTCLFKNIRKALLQHKLKYRNSHDYNYNLLIYLLWQKNTYVQYSDYGKKYGYKGTGLAWGCSCNN